jgi:acetyl-CoA carboxylase carboxyl transferase subunit alpha
LSDEHVKKTILPCEEAILRLGKSIDRLTRLAGSSRQDSIQVEHLDATYSQIKAEFYRHLSAWDIVQIARHPDRPGVLDYIDMIVTDFCELHGDRLFGDDSAIITGLGRIATRKVLIVGHNKGKTLSEKTKSNFGCAHPEGYRKALLKMKLAEKFGLPIVCIIDTPGADPGAGSEERGQARAIAVNLMEMSRLRVPIVCIIIGEGGSGGALGIGVGDRVAIMQYAYFSVISPEGCAAILWGTKTKASLAAEALKLTGRALRQTGYVDTIIPEPPGGAHRNKWSAAYNLRAYLTRTLRELDRCEISTLLENRYQMLRRIGSSPANHGNDLTEQ